MLANCFPKKTGYEQIHGIKHVFQLRIADLLRRCAQHTLREKKQIKGVQC